MVTEEYIIMHISKYTLLCSSTSIMKAPRCQTLGEESIYNLCYKSIIYAFNSVNYIKYLMIIMLHYASIQESS